jgi:diphosphomevalonate decarboxylase
MHWFAQAPANIALIKYMGKKDKKNNIPSNPSLSYTLDRLISNVALEVYPGKKDIWEPLETPGVPSFSLSSTSQARFLAHLDFLKTQINYQGAFIVRSNNNFPMGSGIASSASSFAALTRCAVRALSELTDTPLPDTKTEAMLSQKGSGSSCRSFFSPWALWTEDDIKSVTIPYSDLLHQVIVVSHEEKSVPSTQAHALVETSSHFKGRSKRAKENLKQLFEAFENKDWRKAYEVCWHEFSDMHQMFQTSSPSFDYMTDASKALLIQIQKDWEVYGDGPIVTMDAGPNIHLIYQQSQQDVAARFKSDHLLGNYDVL